MTIDPRDFPEFKLASPATLDAVERIERYRERPLPAEYRSFLLTHNGGEGFIGNNYLVLWRAEDLLSFNDDYGTTEDAPWLLLIGSNGAGEGYGFDLRQEESQIVAVPLDTLDPADAVLAGSSFNSFIAVLAKGRIW